MNIIEWSEPVEATLGTKESKEYFLRILAGKVGTKWQGDILHKTKANIPFYAPFIELRKTLGEAQVLIRIGHKILQKYRPDPPDHAVVSMSMNGTSQFIPDDFAELNLVVMEAMEVYETLQ